MLLCQDILHFYTSSTSCSVGLSIAICWSMTLP
ncbi:hypothetical protein PANA5342_1688 [Pantoea ananatis LMG 5342]|nr:hypothetical protein PANA5342_1688 [Pantoea ananatis LMG 5342]